MDLNLRLLDPYFVKKHHITVQTPCHTDQRDALTLLSHHRLDLVVKLNYIHAYMTNDQVNPAQDLYEEHIRAFTDGTFKEHGNLNKSSFKAYLETFHHLIDAFDKGDFNTHATLIPLGWNGAILDGAHRVACAIYFKLRVTVAVFDHLHVDYGFAFFKKRLMMKEDLNQMIRLYVAHQQGVRCTLLWPRAYANHHVEVVSQAYLKAGGGLFYQGKGHMSKQTFTDLLTAIYGNEHWIGHTINGFKGIQDKVNHTYKDQIPTGIFLTDALTTDDLLKHKDQMRDIFGSQSHSMHTTDTHQEAVFLAQVFLSPQGPLVANDAASKITSMPNLWGILLLRKLKFYYRKTLMKLKKMFHYPV